MPERPGPEKDDQFGDRAPTSHERMAGQSWDASYQDGPAPWDIGGPQPAVERLVTARGFTGAVLDVGCGTGENSLLIAAQGSPVLGVDIAETALETALSNATERGLQAEFATADALHLERSGRRFDTVLDSGLFHTLDAGERVEYVRSVTAVTEPGATLYVLCFSDTGPEPGPHPVRLDELVDAFTPSAGWRIESIEAERVATRFHEHGAPGWLATMTRVPVGASQPAVDHTGRHG